jgi:hypothetical protein
MVEFVIVHCSDNATCEVFIDNQPNGWTDEVLEVEAGTHSFSLCTCPGEVHEPEECFAARYRPTSQRLQVTNTFRAFPLEVHFEIVS